MNRTQRSAVVLLLAAAVAAYEQDNRSAVEESLPATLSSTAEPARPSLGTHLKAFVDRRLGRNRWLEAPSPSVQSRSSPSSAGE